MPRDYRLHEINDREFERPVVRIRANWLGQGSSRVEGRGGGRDTKFTKYLNPLRVFAIMLRSLKRRA